MSVRSVVVVMCLLLWPGMASAELSMSFGDQEVTISGLTPGGQVAIVAVARKAVDGINQVVRHSTFIADDDQDGSATLTLEVDLIPRSVWMAVEYETGSTIVGSPGGAGTSTTFDPANNIFQDEAGNYRFVRVKRSTADIAVIRPNVGGWHLRAWDGGTGDYDGESDGRIFVDTTTMNPIGGTEDPLGSLAVGDVLIGLDPRRLEFHVGVLETLPGGGG